MPDRPQPLVYANAAHRRWHSLPDTIREAAVRDRELGRMAEDYMHGRIERTAMVEQMFAHAWRLAEARRIEAEREVYP